MGGRRNGLDANKEALRQRNDDWYSFVAGHREVRTDYQMKCVGCGGTENAGLHRGEPRCPSCF